MSCEAEPMAGKWELQQWILEALETRGGEAHWVELAKDIWQVHEHDLRASGDFFYRWQYDMGWAAQNLRDSGRLEKIGRSGTWSLPPKSED